MRLLDAAQNFSADTDLRLESGDLCYVEELLRIVRAEFFAQAIAALRNCPNAAPLPVADFEDVADQPLCREIAGLVEDARVLILRHCAPFLQLHDRHQRSL